MQVCREQVSGRSVLLAFEGGPAPPQPPPWDAAMSRLGVVLSPRQRLDVLCAIVAAELSLSMVAVLRREADGSLSRIAGAAAPAGPGQVHDHRGIDGMFVGPPADAEPVQDIACWTFADRGRTDLLFFAGLRPLDGDRQWVEWARQIATSVVSTPLHGLRPAAALTAGDDARPSRAAAAAWRARVKFASLDVDPDRGIEAPEDEDATGEEMHVHVTLEGLEAFEPLGKGALRRMLDACKARIVAIAGEDRVARLPDGSYVVSLAGPPSSRSQILDAMRRALLSPVPGIGALRALRVRFTLA